MKTPLFFVVEVFLYCQTVSDLDRQEHPIVDKLLHLDDVQSFEYGIHDLVANGHELLGNVSFCISSLIA